jgi:hypothetical protein
MKAISIFIGIFVIIFFSVLISSSTTATTTNVITHPGGGGGNSSGNYNPYNNTLNPPSITFNPLPEPSLPSFPGIWVNFSIPLVGTFNLSLPNFAKLPNFFEAYASYIFEWIGVQIANFFLALVQAFYFVFAYIEYLILDAIITASESAGIFALPIMVTIVIVISMIISLLIHFAKDITIIGAE